MAIKPHLYYQGDRLHRGEFRYSRRYVGQEDEGDPDRDYRPMQDVFLQSLNRF